MGSFQHTKDRGPLLRPDPNQPSDYGDSEIDWTEVSDGESSYYRRADGRVAAPSGHCPEARIIGDTEQGIEGLNERQKMFLYFMANSSPNKGGVGDKPGLGYFEDFKDQLSPEELEHYASNSIRVAGISKLQLLPKAWQDWLLTEEADQLFEPYSWTAGSMFDGSGAGVHALLHWHEYPQQRDEKGRLSGGCIVLGHGVSAAVFETLDHMFDQVPRHLKDLYQHCKSQCESELERRALHWWFTSEGLDPLETLAFIDWKQEEQNQPELDFYSRIFEQRFRQKDQKAWMARHAPEVLAAIYELLPACLRPSWDVAKAITAIPTIKRFEGRHVLDMDDPDVKAKVKHADDLLSYKDAFGETAYALYDHPGADELVWKPIVDELAEATAEDVERWWKPWCLNPNPGAKGDLEGRFSWAGPTAETDFFSESFQTDCRRFGVKLPKAPPA